MRYTLYSNGKLLDGASEEKALQALLKISHASEEEAREKFLSGRRKKISSSENGERLKKITKYLRQAGLDVELVCISEASTRTGKRVKKGLKRSLAASLLLMLLIVGALGAYAWYWLYKTVPGPLLIAEEALADGNMVALGYMDVEKLEFLDKYLLGGMDPGAIPMSDDKRDIVEKLFTGPANFKENLKQVFLSVHATPQQDSASATFVLAGNFNAEAILGELGASYKITAAGKNRWTLDENQAPPAAGLKESPCEEEAAASPKMSKPTTLHLQISPHWLMLSDNHEVSAKLWQRLKSASRAGQDIKKWHAYREGQLAAIMLFVPNQAVKAVSGLPGMIAQGATKKAPDLNAAAAAVTVNIPSAGLNLNLTMYSGNSQWNTKTAEEARRKIDNMKADSRAVSPTFADLLSHISLTDSGELLAVDIKLGSDILDNIKDIFQEVMVNLFTPPASMGGQKEPAQEQINEFPADYSLYVGLTKLPDVKPDEHSQPPLFRKGAFAVNMESASMLDDGIIQLELKGLVALKKVKDSMQTGTEKVSMFVDSVEGRDGTNILRDERCLPKGKVFGSLNHEEESNFSRFDNQASITKRIRLHPGVLPEGVAGISGKLRFSAPVAVKKYSLKLQAGKTVEHNGLRFYLSAIKGSTVSYHISGKNKNFLELRALNKDGKVLKNKWSMNSGGEGRASIGFAGEIHKMELFVAEKMYEEEMPFVLTNIFAVPAKQEKKVREYFAPKSIDLDNWKEYAWQNMKNLKVDRKEILQWENNKRIIAETGWDTMKMYLTHKPDKWANNPTAHLFMPFLPELPGVLSAFSYIVEEPASDKGPRYIYNRIFYPYYTESGDFAIKHYLDKLPVNLQRVTMQSGLKENEKLKRFKGKFIVRLPLEAVATKLPLIDLWQGVEVEGIKVSLTEISRGMFPGYALKIEGKIDRLVNLHGLTSRGARVSADPVNFQDGGYWTMTLPFGTESVKLITASNQKIIEYPFDLKPRYPAK